MPCAIRPVNLTMSKSCSHIDGFGIGGGFEIEVVEHIWVVGKSKINFIKISSKRNKIDIKWLKVSYG